MISFPWEFRRCLIVALSIASSICLFLDTEYYYRVAGYINLSSLFLLLWCFIHFPYLNWKPHWRMVLLYVLIIIFSVIFIVRVSVNSISTHAENITIGILLLLISLITAVLLIILPVPSMGPLNGTYKQIGTFSYHIPITLKEQSQFYQDNQTYNLNIQCWFPIINDKTSNNNCNVIMYSYEWIYELICLLFWNKFTILWTSGDPAQQAIESNQLLEFTAQDSGLPSFILTHLSLAHSNSMFIDIHTPEGQSMLPVSFTKMNDSINKFPIAIYSHGMYAWRQIASVTFEMLASNGYVVFSVDHLPSAMVTRPVNNIHNSVTFDYLLPSHIESGSANERVFYHGGIDRRAQEIIQVIDHLESILKADTVISNTQHNLNTSTSYSDVISTTISYLNLDISKLHIFGHSFGGGTCAAVSCRDTRVKSCVILDSWLYPVHDDDRVKGSLSANLLVLSSEFWEVGVYQAPFRKELCENTRNNRKDNSTTNGSDANVNVFNLTMRGSDHQNFCDTHLLGSTTILRKQNFLGSANPFQCVSARDHLTLRFFEGGNVNNYAKDLKSKLESEQLFDFCQIHESTANGSIENLDATTKNFILDSIVDSSTLPHCSHNKYYDKVKNKI